jgi:hypothetical protein
MAAPNTSSVDFLPNLRCRARPTLWILLLRERAIKPGVPSSN